MSDAERLRLPSNNRLQLQLFIIVVVTALLSYLVGSNTFHHAFLTTDEGSYVFQAQNFLDGRVARKTPPFGGALQHQMIIQDIDAGWLSRYPPLHSLWLAPGVALDNPYALVALSAGLSLLCIVLTVRTLGLRFGPVVVLLLCSPYFLFMHGTLLSHSSGLLCTSLLLWAYISWLVKRRRCWLVIAGLSWGLLFLGRPYTAFLLAMPFGITSLLILNRKRDMSTLKATAIFVLSSSSGVIGLLFYNYVAVGDPFTMTFFYYDATEGLGFGMRHTQGEPTSHTLGRGLMVLWDNLKSLDRWLLGWPGSLVGLAMLLLIGWRSVITPLLLGGIVALPLGYIFFWYEGIQIAGPVYYYESLPFLMVGAGMGVSMILKRFHNGTNLSRIIFTALFFLLIGGAFHHSYSTIKGYGSDFKERRELRRVIDNAPPKSIVILPNWYGQLFLMLNAEGLNSDPLVIKRHPDHWLGLTRLYPDRTVHRLARGKNPHLIELKPSKRFVIDLPAGDFTSDADRFGMEGEAEQIIALVGGQEPALIGHGELFWLFPGQFKVTYNGHINGAEPGRPGSIVEFIEYGSKKSIHQETIRSAEPHLPAQFCIEIDKPVLLEPQIYSTGHADVTFRGLRIEETVYGCR